MNHVKPYTPAEAKANAPVLPDQLVEAINQKLTLSYDHRVHITKSELDAIEGVYGVNIYLVAKVYRSYGWNVEVNTPDVDGIFDPFLVFTPK